MPLRISSPGRDGLLAVPLITRRDLVNRLAARQSIIVLPVMASMIATMVSVIVISGMIVDAPVIVIITLPGVTIAALIIARHVITGRHPKAHTEIVSLRL
jgi:hypothetical protein